MKLNKKGFTMIECVIAMAIILIMTVPLISLLTINNDTEYDVSELFGAKNVANSSLKAFQYSNGVQDFNTRLSTVYDALDFEVEQAEPVEFGNDEKITLDFSNRYKISGYQYSGGVLSVMSGDSVLFSANDKDAIAWNKIKTEGISAYLTEVDETWSYVGYASNDSYFDELNQKYESINGDILKSTFKGYINTMSNFAVKIYFNRTINVKMSNRSWSYTASAGVDNVKTVGNTSSSYLNSNASYDFNEIKKTNLSSWTDVDSSIKSIKDAKLSVLNTKDIKTILSAIEKLGVSTLPTDYYTESYTMTLNNGIMKASGSELHTAEIVCKNGHTYFVIKHDKLTVVEIEIDNNISSISSSTVGGEIGEIGKLKSFTANMSYSQSITSDYAFATKDNSTGDYTFKFSNNPTYTLYSISKDSLNRYLGYVGIAFNDYKIRYKYVSDYGKNIDLGGPFSDTKNDYILSTTSLYSNQIYFYCNNGVWTTSPNEQVITSEQRNQFVTEENLYLDGGNYYLYKFELIELTINTKYKGYGVYSGGTITKKVYYYKIYNKLNKNEVYYLVNGSIITTSPDTWFSSIQNQEYSATSGNNNKQKRASAQSNAEAAINNIITSKSLTTSKPSVNTYYSSLLTQKTANSQTYQYYTISYDGTQYWNGTTFVEGLYKITKEQYDAFLTSSDIKYYWSFSPVALYLKGTIDSTGSEFKVKYNKWIAVGSDSKTISLSYGDSVFDSVRKTYKNDIGNESGTYATVYTFNSYPYYIQYKDNTVALLDKLGGEIFKFEQKNFANEGNLLAEWNKWVIGQTSSPKIYSQVSGNTYKYEIESKYRVKVCLTPVESEGGHKITSIGIVNADYSDNNMTIFFAHDYGDGINNIAESVFGKTITASGAVYTYPYEVEGTIKYTIALIVDYSRNAMRCVSIVIDGDYHTTNRNIVEELTLEDYEATLGNKIKYSTGIYTKG